MRCDDVLIELVALDRGELAPGAAAAVERHVASCAGCAEELRRARSVRTLFVSATTLPAAGESRVMSAVDDALAASGAERSSGSSRGRVLDLWARARQRYDQSSSVRRFAIASLGVHAAAAVVLAAVLAGGGASRDRSVVSVSMPDELALPSQSDGLVAWVPMAIDGVAAPTGRVFPTAATARLATVLDPPQRVALLADAAGPDAPSVDRAAARGVAWLLARQSADGSFGGAADPSARMNDTALALLALGADGRTSSDPAIARAAGWLSAALSDDAPAATPVAHANAVRSLVRQFSLDFADLGTDARARRAEAIARASGRLASRQRGDGAFASASGAIDVAGTVTSFVALAEVREAGVADHGRALLAASAAIDLRRDASGILPLNDAERGRALSASLVAAERSLGRPRIADADAARFSSRVASTAGVRGLAAGIDVLRATGRDVAHPLRRAVSLQAADGSWSEPRATGVEATACAVLALRRPWRR